MKLFKYFIEFIVIIIFFSICKLLGVKKSSNLACTIFKKIGPLIRSNSKTLNHIKIAFPTIKNNEIEKITNNMWCNYGRTFAEYMHLEYFRKNKNDNVKIMNSEKLLNLKNSKKPILFFSGHFANFELLAMYLDKNNLNISALYRPLNNIFLNPIMENLRKKYICNNQIPKTIPGQEKYKYAAKELIKKIKKKENIALMIDQKVTQGIKIDLFNRKALTMNLPAQMALKYNYILQPLKIKRIKEINFLIDVDEPIQTSSTDDIESVTKKINIKLEDMIKENPNQWIWTHKRWKI
jgi:Kdo2-lipid IVA lauroyltransferase/acyltransferase